MIEKIEAYKTSDGVVFDNYIQASVHDEKYKEYMKQHPNKIPNTLKYLTACGKYIDVYENKFTINEILASDFMCIPTCNGNYLWYDVQTKMVYVGETTNLNSRVKVFISDGNYSSKLDKIRKSSNKEERWIFFILNTDIDENDLKYIETELMLEYDSINPLHGYNGGISIKGTKEENARIQKEKEEKERLKVEKRKAKEKKFIEEHQEEYNFYSIEDGEEFAPCSEEGHEDDYESYFRNIKTNLSHKEFDIEKFKKNLLNYRIETDFGYTFDPTFFMSDNGYNFVWCNYEDINKECDEIIEIIDNIIIVNHYNTIQIHVYFSDAEVSYAERQYYNDEEDDEYYSEYDDDYDDEID